MSTTPASRLNDDFDSLSTWPTSPWIPAVTSTVSSPSSSPTTSPISPPTNLDLTSPVTSSTSSSSSTSMVKLTPATHRPIPPRSGITFHAELPPGSPVLFPAPMSKMRRVRPGSAGGLELGASGKKGQLERAKERGAGKFGARSKEV